MFEGQSGQLSEDYVGDGFQPPDLRPLRKLAEREELADARACLANGMGDPLPTDGRYAPAGARCGRSADRGRTHLAQPRGDRKLSSWRKLGRPSDGRPRTTAGRQHR